MQLLINGHSSQMDKTSIKILTSLVLNVQTYDVLKRQKREPRYSDPYFSILKKHLKASGRLQLQRTEVDSTSGKDL